MATDSVFPFPMSGLAPAGKAKHIYFNILGDAPLVPIKGDDDSTFWCVPLFTADDLASEFAGKVLRQHVGRVQITDAKALAEYLEPLKAGAVYVAIDPGKPSARPVRLADLL